jgi:hypothetical protein
VWCFVSIVFLTAVVFTKTASADSGYSIRLVKVNPKRGTHLVVGEHVAVSITVKYKLAATEKGKVALVIQKDDNSFVSPGHQQIRKEIARGSGEATLSDEFDVPPGTTLIRLFVPLVPEGYAHTSGEVVVEYPVQQK